MTTSRGAARRHQHIIPRGAPPDRIGWTSTHTARSWGRRLYGSGNYRLIWCSGNCAIYPPVSSTRVPGESELSDGH